MLNRQKIALLVLVLVAGVAGVAALRGALASSQSISLEPEISGDVRVVDDDVASGGQYVSFEEQSYNWHTIKVGAGGFITGIEASNDGKLVLVQTDTYGGYRLIGGAGGSSWKQIVQSDTMPADDVNPENPLGVYALAVSPSDSTRAYMYFKGSIYRTTNGAASWQRTALRDKFASTVDDNIKFYNNKMAVHPTNPAIMLVGVPEDGLYRTADGGDTFSRVGSIPSGGAAGINSIYFSRRNPSVVYASGDGIGVYFSTDSGQNWARTNGGPSRTFDIEVANDGVMYAVDGGNEVGVWRYASGAWTNLNDRSMDEISRSVVVDPDNSNNVTVLSIDGDLIYSTNGGQSWTSTGNNRTRVANDIPWLAWTDEPSMSAAELLIDPLERDRLWFTQGLGVWTTRRSQASPSGVTWTSVSDGIEQLVGNDIDSPPGLNRRIMSAWDRPIFTSSDPSQYPSTHGPTNKFNHAWAVDWSASDPTWMAAHLSNFDPQRSPLQPSYSEDGGLNWKAFPSNPEGATNGQEWGLGGTLAVGDPGNVVIIPACNADCGKAQPYYTKDAGQTWLPTSGLPVDSSLYSWFFFKRHNLTADRSNPDVFYAYHADDGVYRSTDKGANWSRMGDAATAVGQFGLTMKSVPGHEGHLFLSAGYQQGEEVLNGQPFYRSTDGGATWQSIDGFLEVYTFAYGKAAAGRDYPAIYAAGWLNEEYGIYRSIDNAENWTKVGDYPDGWLDSPVAMDADKDTFGCVYIALNGGGFKQGCPRF